MSQENVKKLIARLTCWIAVPAVFCWAGCATQDPVKGWTMWDARLSFPDLQNYHNYPEASYYSPDKLHHVDKAVVDDFQKFVQSMKQKNPGLYVSNIYFYEDATGQHAVRLLMEVGPRAYAEYFLVYDRSNSRTDVIKGRKLHQFHI